MPRFCSVRLDLALHRSIALPNKFAKDDTNHVLRFRSYIILKCLKHLKERFYLSKILVYLATPRRFVSVSKTLSNLFSASGEIIPRSA